MSRTIMLAVTVVAMAVAAPSVVAAITEKDATTLLLRKADVAANATYEADEGTETALEDRFKAAGLSGNAANYVGAKYDKAAKTFRQVTGVVVVTKSAAQSRKAFGIVSKFVEERRKQFGDLGTALPASSLPSLGDQQSARYFPAGNEGIGRLALLVRKNTAVWTLEVNLERRPKIPTQAELVSLARTYGLAQKTRVGAG